MKGKLDVSSAEPRIPLHFLISRDSAQLTLGWWELSVSTGGALTKGTTLLSGPTGRCHPLEWKFPGRKETFLSDATTLPTHPSAPSSLHSALF